MTFRGRLLLVALAAAWLFHGTASAQQPFSFHGSLESNSVYDDEGDSPYKGFHSNNYLKLTASKGRFSAGLQAEWYPDPMPGFDLSLKGFGVPLKYVAWDGGNWQVTAGDFYEQFGSGLVLRSWEDRDLGLNNSLGGLRLGADFLDGALSLKGLGAVPRSGLGYASTAVFGGDAVLSLLQLIAPGSAHALTLEGSVLDRYEWRTEEDIAVLLGAPAPENVLLYSARMSYAWQSLLVKAEYVGKGKDFSAVHQNGASDTYTLSGGKAATVEVNYASGPFSGTVSWRYLDNMASRAYRTTGTLGISNTLNYLPALCQQQTYMLAGLNPYETYVEGENGVRGDFYYRFRRGSALGGKYGMKLHVGGSWIDALGKVLPRRDGNYLAYRDLNIDLDRTWSRRFKTTFFVSIQENSPTHGNRKATNAQNVFVLEGLNKLSRTVSLRWELQYLYSEELTRDWMAGLLEVGIAPSWSLSVSDMYNHGDTGEHYWNASVAYSKESFRVMLSYGRRREGMFCSGGVCRWQPEYKGAGLALQWSF